MAARKSWSEKKVCPIRNIKDNHNQVVHRTVMLVVIEFLKNLHSKSKIDSWFFNLDMASAYWAIVCAEYLPTTRMKLFEHLSKNPELPCLIFPVFLYVKMKKNRRPIFIDEDLPRAPDDESAIILKEMWQKLFEDWF